VRGMDAESKAVSEINLLGGALCLDFANTVEERYPQAEGNYLNTYADLVDWHVRVDVLTPVEADALRRAAEKKPQDAVMVLERALILRETIYRIFSAIAQEQEPAVGDLRTINGILVNAQPHLSLVRHGDHYHWQWTGTPDNLARLLWMPAQSTVELLTLGDLNRVHECPPPEGCGWLFLDTSKNHSRRWCDMKTCGNAAKARRHYQRKRAGG
jgi:predicted RNA-binding Zn ribbon-like protein